MKYYISDLHLFHKNVTGEEILDICSAYMSADDLKLVEKAWHYATDAHSGQFRQSGEPYIIHLFRWQVSWQISILMQ